MTWRILWAFSIWLYSSRVGEDAWRNRVACWAFHRACRKATRVS
jgi:hypothetical protein